MSRRALAAGGAALALALLAAGAAPGPARVAGPAPRPAPARAADSGFERFVEACADEARACARRRDWDDARRAWERVLELDPRSIVALEGVAEASNKAGDVDGELAARVELVAAWRRRLALGERGAERELDDAREALGRVDPFPGRAELIVARASEVDAEVGRAYLDAGWFNCALDAWRRRKETTLPGSPEREEARAALARILRDGGDDVAEAGLGPAEDVDEAWIEEHDRKSAKWGRAARFETPHYRVKTNAGWRIGAMAAEAMERVHAFYREVWGIVPDPPPDPVPEGLREISITPIDLNIYADREEYLRRSGAPEWSGGVFTGSEVATWDTGQRGTMQTLFHEASHQFMREAVGNVPSFVNEGMACLFEGIELRSNGSIRRDLPALRYLRPLADELRGGAPGALRRAMGGKDAGKNDPDFYKYRWGVFYYLRMAVDEQGSYLYRDRLDDYVYGFKRGAPGDMVEQFTEHFVTGAGVAGVATFDDFEARWRAWILDLADELRDSDARLDRYRAAAETAAAQGDAEGAARFAERALDLDPEDVDALWTLAEACRDLGRADRAAACYRRFADRTGPGDRRYADAGRHVAEIDEQEPRRAAADEVLAERLLELSRAYEQAGMPRAAQACAGLLLERRPHLVEAREAVARLTESTGRPLHPWRRLFNGFDLDGWTPSDGPPVFAAEEGVLVARWLGSDAAAGDDGASEAPGGPPTLYRTLMLDRNAAGDWALSAHIETDAGWQIVGLCFGARSNDDFDAIVLRNRAGTRRNSVDYGTFDGDWAFRGDGSMRVEYDPEAGVDLEIEVRGREVFVTIDCEPVEPIVGKRQLPSMKYPLGALRGDVGLLVSPGTTRFTDLRLRAR